MNIGDEISSSGGNQATDFPNTYQVSSSATLQNDLSEFYVAYMHIAQCILKTKFSTHIEE